MKALANLPARSANDLTGPKFGRGGALILTETMLRYRTRFFYEIRHNRDLPQKIRAMLSASFIFMALYGALLGSTHSLWQALSSAFKLPLLFLITLLICAPVLYIFSAFFGLNQSLRQSLALVMSAITVTALILLALAPLTLFFIITTSDSYQFFKLLNVFFFIVAGVSGGFFLYSGLGSNMTLGSQPARPRQFVFWLWIAIYIFVGSQMAWTLRPFVGYPNSPFELFRQVGGNFYANILSSLGEILGFLIVK